MCHPDFFLVEVADDRRNRRRRRQPVWAETATVEANQQAQTELAREVNRDGATKKYCMCSPTRHPGSFRCRYHRSEYIWLGRRGPMSR
ncbi:hypothetical protein I3843_01G230700 [Carya illinoinensis]|uniref:Uncharacterized protein n=1 Tax=Carya illinoinensis TaxID=32201 RepID=A0A8T1RTT7_CARIL|nr:hypothetical protein CIPAW_01G239000 [Carya illinoinensis]KAG6733751.1 hypothetical protein I3842_01G240100 [Carya illinoinensis]KAG7997856.1 hypothetical protein I3843_01G230700 [Carya illinoinensis]